MGHSLGSGLESLLNNPIVQGLVPAVAGGVGLALATPRGAGLKAEIGRGSQGAAGGYERGQENKELSAKTELVQMQAQQIKAQMANQKALTAMAPIWAKDIPEDQRPVFNALISSTDPKEQQQAFEMRTRELAKPASIAGIVALNPQLKAPI